MLPAIDGGAEPAAAAAAATAVAAAVAEALSSCTADWPLVVQVLEVGAPSVVMPGRSGGLMMMRWPAIEGGLKAETSY